MTSERERKECGSRKGAVFYAYREDISFIIENKTACTRASKNVGRIFRR